MSPPGPATPLLETRGLSLRAAGRPLVEGLDWQVHAGERWCVIGRNAAGKSTLLRALAGLAVPERQGQVRWLGRAQVDWPVADAAWARAYAHYGQDYYPKWLCAVPYSPVTGPRGAGGSVGSLMARPLA